MLLSLTRRARPVLAVIASAILLFLLVCTAPRHSDAQSPVTHTLTQADNRTTLTVPIGDTVELRLPTTFTWDVTITNLGVLTRPPVALARGVQGLWMASSPGESVIAATGSPQCDPGQPCPLIAAVFSATVEVVPAVTSSGGCTLQTFPPRPCPSPSASPASGPTVTYAAGWNLVGGPAGTAFPGRLFAWAPASSSYQSPDTNSIDAAGNGYWAYFATTTDLFFSSPGQPDVAVAIPPGRWLQVGNPSATANVSISGADAVFTYDVRAGAYTAATALSPGQGAWVYSASGGTIRIRPMSGGG